MVHIKKIFKFNDQREFLSQETHYILDADGKETERQVYGANGQLKLHTFFMYNSNGYLIKTITQNHNGHLLSTVELIYDDMDQLTRRLFYDGNRTLVAQHFWEYDPRVPNRLLMFGKIGKNEMPVFIQKFHYDANGNLIKEEHFSPDGRIKILKLKAYDDQNREQSETILENGTDFKARKLILHDVRNLPVEISWYDAEDKIQRLECFDYGDNGILLNEIILDFYGQRSFFKHYNDKGKIEYLLRKHNRQPVAEETYEYETQDRLILRQKFAIKGEQKILAEEERHTYQS